MLLLAAALAFPAGSPLSDVTVGEPLPNVFHLDFRDKAKLASTFMRFQEHYESPKYRGKVFSREEFLAWYATTEKGKKSGYFDWDGFNVPAAAFERFYKGDFDPLTAEEKALLELLKGREGFYVIGTSKAGTLRHELAHALYHVEPRYRAKATRLLSGVDLGPVRAMLERLGYHRDVWDDEAQAWLGDDEADLTGEGLDPKPYRALRRQLRAAAAPYLGSRKTPAKSSSPVSRSSIK